MKAKPSAADRPDSAAAQIRESPLRREEAAPGVFTLDVDGEGTEPETELVGVMRPLDDCSPESPDGVDVGAGDAPPADEAPADEERGLSLGNRHDSGGRGAGRVCVDAIAEGELGDGQGRAQRVGQRAYWRLAWSVGCCVPGANAHGARCVARRRRRPGRRK